MMLITSASGLKNNGKLVSSLKQADQQLAENLRWATSYWDSLFAAKQSDDHRYLFFILISPETGQLQSWALWQLMMDRKDASLLKVMTTSQAKRSGGATKILQHSRFILAQLTIENLWLEVSEENTLARKLYLKHGFQQVRFIKNFYSNGENGFLMRCSCR